MAEKTFTMVYDLLRWKYADNTLADVFGKIERLTNKKKYCYASQDFIAKELCLSRQTVNAKIKILVTEGYIQDDTPGLVNRTHILKVTNKLDDELESLSEIRGELTATGLTVSLFEVIAYVKITPILRRLIESGVIQFDVNVEQDDTTVKPVDTHCKPALHEYTSNKEMNRELNKQLYALESAKPDSQAETFAKAQVSIDMGIPSKEYSFDIQSEIHNLFGAPAIAARAALEEQEID
jgi:DNA-binding MarR family transcriptional regulator